MQDTIIGRVFFFTSDSQKTVLFIMLLYAIVMTSNLKLDTIIEHHLAINKVFWC